MPLEQALVHRTEFPQNPLSPLRLYSALYASQVETITQKGLFSPSEDKTTLSIVDHCNLYPGSILRRNTVYMEVYFCGPLTSAGAIRIPGNPGSPFRQNTMVAEIFRDTLIPQLKEESRGMSVHLTIPGHIGVRDHFSEGIGWGEGDYNVFWLFYLSGIDPVSARQFNTRSSTKEEIGIINNKKLDRNQHKSAYQRMVDDFIAFVNDPSTGCRMNKMSKIITLPDNQHSFGSQMEIRLAKGIGITVEEARVNPKWIREQQQLWFNQHQQLNPLDGVDFTLPEDNLTDQISLQRIN